MAIIYYAEQCKNEKTYRKGVNSCTFVEYPELLFIISATLGASP